MICQINHCGLLGCIFGCRLVHSILILDAFSRLSAPIPNRFFLRFFSTRKGKFVFLFGNRCCFIFLLGDKGLSFKGSLFSTGQFCLAYVNAFVIMVSSVAKTALSFIMYSSSCNAFNVETHLFLPLGFMCCFLCFNWL